MNDDYCCGRNFAGKPCDCNTTEVSESSLTDLLSFFDGKAPVVEVFYETRENMFICAVVGALTIEHMQEIEQEVRECADFAEGDGVYIFKCRHHPEQFDPDTLGSLDGAYWEVTQVKYSEFET